jgi:hypothetical protein
MPSGGHIHPISGHHNGAERLPQKQGLCQVVKMPDFGNVIRLLTGIDQRQALTLHDTVAYKIGKQVNVYADILGRLLHETENASGKGVWIGNLAWKFSQPLRWSVRTG